MKVSIKKETSIIDLPEQDAMQLIKVNPNGHFEYLLSYAVDPRKAVQNKAILVKVFASTKPFTAQPTNSLIIANATQTIKNIQQKSSVSKDKGRAKIKDVFFTYISDISARIPNDRAAGLSGRQPQQSTNPILRTDRLVKLRSVSEITSTNVVLPVLENNISRALISPDVLRNATVARSVSINLQTHRAIDPAMISGARTQTIQSARSVSGGIISQPSGLMDRMSLTQTQRVSLIGNLINGNNPTSHTQLSPSDYVNILVDAPRTTLDIKETLEIPSNLLQADEFFIILQLVNNQGIEVQTLSVSVPHSKNVANLQIPIIPPGMTILQNGLLGKNVINIKQLDPNASGVSVYRKEIKKGSPNLDAVYTFIGDIQTKLGQDFVRMTDAVNNYAPIVYRGVAYNSAGILSSEFTSVVSRAIKQNNNNKQERRHNFVSIVGEVVDSTISIEIRDVPPGVCLVSLFRKNLSTYEKEFTQALRATQVTNSEMCAPIFLVDSNVQNDRIYEYQVRLLFPDGKVENATNNLIIKFEPIVTNIINTTITDQSVVRSGTDIDFTFFLGSTIILADVDLIKKTLEDQGLLGYYQDGIIEDKHKLQNLIAYNVKRTNITTGESEDFGIVSGGVFSDKASGVVKSVKALDAGSEYRYFVTTYFRKAETSLEQVTRTVTLPRSSYVFSPSKWLHPITLRRGGITTSGSRQKNHAQTVFSFGTVGGIISTNISLANILPSISEAHAQRLGKNSNLIQWRVQGQVTKIDHFIIVLEMLGMRTVVGKAHNISESNYFQFVDSLDDNEHGKLKYYIVPIFYDFNTGTEVSTNEVVI